MLAVQGVNYCLILSDRTVPLGASFQNASSYRGARGAYKWLSFTAQFLMAVRFLSVSMWDSSHCDLWRQALGRSPIKSWGIPPQLLSPHLKHFLKLRIGPLNSTSHRRVEVEVGLSHQGIHEDHFVLFLELILLNTWGRTHKTLGGESNSSSWGEAGWQSQAGSQRGI